MASNNLMDKIRSFFGIQQQPPKNEFRNPIWGSDDEDDGDELYTRQSMDIYRDPNDLQRDITKQMNDMLKSFGNMFGDMKTFFEDEHFDFSDSFMNEVPEPENHGTETLRDYYLKPGYHNHNQRNIDSDLDGKISSNDISGLLKKKDDSEMLVPASPFNGKLVPGRSFCKTIITTSVTKPDGTVETRRIVKNGNEVVEETTTTTEPVNHSFSSGSSSVTSGPSQFSTSGIIYNTILSEISSIFSHFN